MALGSLIDAGADLDEVLALLERLPFGGWALEVEPVLRGGIAATRAVVTVHDNVVVRTYAHIVGLVEEARLPERVAARALATFAALAEVEAGLHRRPVDQVHFHEVGGHDTIIDVVGTAAALEVLGIDEVWASPVATGTGMVRAAHGMLPNPAPAVVGLLKGVPTWGRDIPVELTTPTGAALLAALRLPGSARCRPCGWAARGSVPGAASSTSCPTAPRWSRSANRTGPGSADPGDPGGRRRPAGRAPRGDRRRRHRRAAGPRRRRPARGRGPRRLAGAGGDEEGATRTRGPRPVRSGPGPGAPWRPAVRDRIAGRADDAAERWPAARSIESVVVEGQLIRVKVSADRVKAEHDDVAWRPAGPGCPCASWPSGPRRLAGRARLGGRPAGTGAPGTTGATRDPRARTHPRLGTTGVPAGRGRPRDPPDRRSDAFRGRRTA